jgi:hypothetical protein
MKERKEGRKEGRMDGWMEGREIKDLGKSIILMVSFLKSAERKRE